MRVFVKSMRGKALMPCSPRKARVLLKEKKAKVEGYNPFTIRLTVPTGETVQKTDVGVDQGMCHIGIAVTSGKKVFAKGHIDLRQDVSELLEARKILRRSRRNRKTRYRKARFLNRKKPEGWLPPSIESKIRNNFRWIDTFCNLLPSPVLHIEVGKFDAARMINPEITGTDYQHGDAYGYYDVRYLVFARDEYTCQCCRKKDRILHTHHIVYRSHGGTDRADNLITVCSECHTAENHKKGGILYEWMIKKKKVKQYKEPRFMNTLRKRTYERYPEAYITYGSVTSPARKKLGLSKSHSNDAVAISGISEIREMPKSEFYIRQFRKKKRSLHEAVPRKGRKIPNILQKRNSKNTKEAYGFHLGDRVVFMGKTGWITGFTGKAAYVKEISGNYITIPCKTYKQISLSLLKQKEFIGNWQYCCL